MFRTPKMDEKIQEIKDLIYKFECENITYEGLMYAIRSIAENELCRIKNSFQTGEF